MASPRLRPISTPMLALAAAVVVTLVAAGTIYYVGEDSADVDAAVAPGIAGVHVLHQFPQPARASGQSVAAYKAAALTELTQRTPALNAALQVPGVVAFGARVPWSIVDADFEVLDRAKAVADANGDQLAVRFMAGVHTPDRIRDACPMFGSGMGRFPRPFDASGAVNACFVTEYRLFVERLAVWARANDVHLLHLSHFANQWAEFYWGPEAQAIAGSGTAGQTAMVNATNALADVGIALSGPDLAFELPMSGHGPLMRPTPSSPPGIAERVTQHVVATVGAQNDRFFIQGNGWNETQIWGAPNPTTAANMDYVLGYGALLGVQMIQPQQYNWTAVFNVAEVKRATYGEVYLPSFTGSSSAQLKAEIGTFVPHVPAGPPPTTTTTTTTLPPTTTTLPPTTTTTTVPVGTCQAVWDGAEVEARQTLQADCRLAAEAA